MGSHNQGKLNWLQRNLPEGLVADAGWFERHDVSRQLRRKYVMNGWLHSLARGVYARPVQSGSSKEYPWQQLVVSLGSLLDVPVAVGARTALELQGFGHYLAAAGPREVHLYANRPLPGWVSKVPVSTPPVTMRRGVQTRSNPALTCGPPGEPALAGAGLTQRRGATWKLTLSTPERGILELLDEVPNRETFHQTDMLMEGLRNLSPKRLHALLADCKTSRSNVSSGRGTPSSRMA
ncbi:MAG: AbiEi antitoxin N-terminal domain-containing protein [Bryobacterales bacterium]|nr:AbiEi antitoxin N-terminal domain-containing protein [Bryobacterales bacterium]